MKDIEERVIEAIDYEGMLEFIKELISIPSYEGKETQAQQFMATKLGEIGFDVDTWMIDFDELGKHPDFSVSFQREEGMGVVGTIKGEGKGRNIIICGHIDTVTPGALENWETPPLNATIVGDRLIGRGSSDMKAGLACGLYAIKAIVDSGIQLKGDMIFESVIGEEDGGCGALATCLRGYSADAGIVMEPSETKIAPEVAGAMSFRITVQGKSVHACVREEGVSAIEKFIVLHEGLKELEIERNKGETNPLYSRYNTPYALSIGKIGGGQWAGTVPESVFFEGRLGVAIGESEEHARRELEQKVHEISSKDPWLKDNPPTVEWRGYSFAYSKVPKEHPIVRTIDTAYRDVTGRPPVYEGMTYASDVRHLINVAKTPTTVFGPGDVRVAHGANEYVLLEELWTTVKTLALTIMRFVG